MARYRILNPVIKTVEQGKQNAGTKYLVAELQNTMCIWEPTQTFTCFIPAIIQAFIPLLSIAHGGSAQQDTQLPEELSTVTGCWVDWVPPQKFYKQHLSSHPAQPATPTRAARPAIQAGEIVKKDGTPILYTTLRIFCQYYIDEFNEKQWIRGGSPEEVGQRAFSAYCVPAKEDGTPQVIPTTQPEIVNGQPVQTAPQPQPQPQPQQGQGQAQFGGQPTPQMPTF